MGSSSEEVSAVNVAFVDEKSAEQTRNSSLAYQDGQPKLRRLFSFSQLLAFALTFMSSWEVVAMNMGATFYNGGPQSLSWGIIVVVIGALAQAASMAELASIQPIAGAQYHWTHFLAPERHRRFITWMQGWVTWFAWVSALAGSTSSEANILAGLVSVNYDYTPEPWHLTVMIIALLVFVGLINTYAFRIIPWLELAAGVLHVVLFLIFVVVLLSLGPRSSADFVFLERSVASGWDNSFVSWNLGLLVPAWGFVGFDGVVHMSEEVRKAKHAVPRAMIWTILVNGLLSYAIILVLLFSMGDSPEQLLNSAYPIVPLCLNVAGRHGGTAMVVGLLIITFCVIVASLASVSRITWAWARDGALPSLFAKVHPSHRVPIPAVWLPVVIVTLLSLLNVGSTAAVAFSAFTALSSLGLYSSYIIAIVCMLQARLSGRLGDQPSNQIRFGEWRLPRSWGTLINIYALVWTVYITIWLPFPTTIPVTGTNMNYAGPVYVFFTTASVMYWFAWGKIRWPGLNAKVIAAVEAER